jgi:Nucleotidyltransferase of unknown function (DUF6036)
VFIVSRSTLCQKTREDRLADMVPAHFQKLRPYAPGPYDLVLSKLERNSPKDRDDAEYLAQSCDLELEVLRERNEKEMRPYLANQARHDLTLKLWLESCFPGRPELAQRWFLSLRSAKPNGFRMAGKREL